MDLVNISPLTYKDEGRLSRKSWVSDPCQSDVIAISFFAINHVPS
jgi:hypothetical protein